MGSGDRQAVLTERPLYCLVVEGEDLSVFDIQREIFPKRLWCSYQTRV